MIDAPPDQAWPVACFDDADQALLHVCAALAREWTGRAQDLAALICALLAQLDILVRRAELQRQRPAAERSVLAAERMIEEHLADRLTIAWLAGQLGVASQTLRAHFAAVRGYSPHVYLQRVRVDHALALVRGSSLTLDAVASMRGYCSASHLSRHVKHATGTSPGAARTAGLAGRGQRLLVAN